MVRVPGFLRPVARWLRKNLRKLGYDIVVAQPQNGDIRMRWLEKLGVDAIIDVGANEGQFVGWMRDRGYAGPIVSFEPHKLAFTALQRRWGGSPGWTGHNLAIGEHAGTVEFHVAGNSVSSSILPMLDSHVDALPESAIVSTERVAIRRLDETDEPTISSAKSLYLKIDTQGYEVAVLKGAAGLFDRTSLLEIELSLVPLYAGQPLAQDVIQIVKDLGFTPIWIEQGFSTPFGDQMLQIDGLFVATSLLQPASMELAKNA